MTTGFLYEDFNITVYASQNTEDRLWVADIRIFSLLGKLKTLDDVAFKTRDEAEQHGIQMPERSAKRPKKEMAKSALQSAGKTFEIKECDLEKGVTAQVSEGQVTLTGEIPRNKLQDTMKAANEAKPKKV